MLAIEAGVAVLADSSWAALQGRDALDLRWTGGLAPTLSDADVAAHLNERAGKPGAMARATGDAAAELARAARKLERHLHPALPGPRADGAAQLPGRGEQRQGQRCEVWAPTQDPDGVRATAARVAGVPLDRRHRPPTLLGGGFGRRTIPDEVAEAVELSARTGRPVQVLWSREDDIRHDRFREASLHRLTGALDAGGTPIAWSHHLVSPSIGGVDSDSGQVDSIATDGASDWPYAIPNVRVEWSSVDAAGAGGRSGGRSATRTTPSWSKVSWTSWLTPGARIRWPCAGGCWRTRPGCGSAWTGSPSAPAGDSPAPAGRALGLAASACFGSFAAQVAEVSLDPAGRPRVHRIWIAADCGLVVNPDIVKAQLEGGIAYGLGAALHGKITIAEGKVVQSNFHDYPQLKLSEMPEVDVTLTASAEPPGGVGELAVPAVAPAVANALFALTGKRVRSLPLAGRSG